MGERDRLVSEERPNEPVPLEDKGSSARSLRLHGRRMMRIDLIVLGGFDGSRFNGAWIDGVAQLLGWLEKGNSFGRDVDFGAGLGVTACASISLAGPEASETADLDLVAGLESADDGFEESIDDDLAIATGEVAE